MSGQDYQINPDDRANPIRITDNYIPPTEYQGMTKWEYILTHVYAGIVGGRVHAGLPPDFEYAAKLAIEATDTLIQEANKHNK